MQRRSQRKRLLDREKRFSLIRFWFDALMALKLNSSLKEARASVVPMKALSYPIIQEMEDATAARRVYSPVVDRLGRWPVLNHAQDGHGGGPQDLNVRARSMIMMQQTLAVQIVVKIP
jgi:hypothetical protein